MLRPKKSSYKEFDNEKKFLRLEISPQPPPPPPITFFNGPSLIHFVIKLSTPFFLQKKSNFKVMNKISRKYTRSSSEYANFSKVL